MGSISETIPKIQMPRGRSIVVENIRRCYFVVIGDMAGGLLVAKIHCHQSDERCGRGGEITK